MSSSDRTQYKQVLIGALGSSRTIANAANCVAQDAQRYEMVTVGTAATAATGTINYSVARLDRPVVIKEVRILPGGTLVGAAGNFQTITLAYTNDGGGAVVNVAQTNTNGTTQNTVTYPGTTGNWAQAVSQLVPFNTSNSQLVPAGSHLYFVQANTGAAGVAIPAGTTFQLIWEEV